MGAPKGNKFGKQFTKANASEMGRRKKGKISIRKQVEIALAKFNDGEFPTKEEATILETAIVFFASLIFFTGITASAVHKIDLFATLIFPLSSKT